MFLLLVYYIELDSNLHFSTLFRFNLEELPPLTYSLIMFSSTIIPLLAIVASTATATSGTASFYGGNTQGGMCSFASYTIPSDLYGTALSSAFWEGSEACGGCITVTGTGGENITAMVSR